MPSLPARATASRALLPRRHAGADRYPRRLARLRASVLLRQLPSRPFESLRADELRRRLPCRSPRQRRKPAAAGRHRHPRLQSQDRRRLRTADQQRRPLQRKAQARRIARRRREARLPRSGTAPLVITVLQSPTKSEASYARKRVYPKVPGYIGKFPTVDIALKTAQARFDFRDEDEQLVGDPDGHLETSALETGSVPRPQLAVSPSLARELVMLRLPPRPGQSGREPGGAARARPRNS